MSRQMGAFTGVKMRISLVVAYTAFLGTAVVLGVQDHQVTLSRSAVFITCFLLLLFGKLQHIRREGLMPLVWFFFASLPGTFLYLLRGDPFIVPMQQYFGLIVMWFVVWKIFEGFSFSPERIFAVYLRCAALSAWIAVIQQVSFLLGIKAIYDLRWLFPGSAELTFAGPFIRVPSVFTEPSYLAIFLMPAVYLAVLRFYKISAQLTLGTSVLLITGLLGTFSTIGYLGLGLCLIAGFRARLRALFACTLLILMTMFIGITNKEVASRLNALPDVLMLNLSGDENLSALSNGVNLMISLKLLGDWPLFGGGLGAYRVYSMDYLSAIVAGDSTLSERAFGAIDHFTLSDGGSMYLRMTSELGICGILVMAFLIGRSLRSAGSPQQVEIARACLIFILVFSLRSGQFIRFDFIFFCALFVLIRLHVRQLKTGLQRSVARPSPTKILT